MSWLDDIVNPASWSSAPATTAAKAAACVVGAPFCVAYDIGESSGSLSKRAREIADQTRRGISGTLEGVTGSATEIIDHSGEAAAAPLDAAARVAMWTAIGIIAVTIIVLALVAFYFLH